MSPRPGGADPDIAERHGISDQPITMPPYRVMLHNDELNSMDHVVYSLLVCVPEVEPDEAVATMLQAHEQGVAQVLACPRERAELYRDRLQGQGLTATIEAA